MRIITVIGLGIALVALAFFVNISNKDLSSLRAELQQLDREQREQEKILVNLNMELSRLKDGANITRKARNLGLRPVTPKQMQYHSQMARYSRSSTAQPISRYAAVSP